MLLVVLALAPPLLACGWCAALAAIAEYRARQQATAEWEEIAGPGTIAEFPITCDFVIEDKPDEASVTPSVP